MLDNDRAFAAGIVGDLAHRLFQGAQDDVAAQLLLAGELQLLERP